MSIRLVFSILSLTFAQVASADVSVTGVSPPPNSIAPSRLPEISVTFSEAVNPATVSPESFIVFGLWSGVSTGELSVSEDGMHATFTPTHPFSAGEHVTVSIARSVTSADGTPLPHGYAWHFLAGTEPASLSLAETAHISVRRKGEGKVQTYGAYAGDFNEDGYTDLAVPNEVSNDFRLFLNDGSGFYPSFHVYPIPGGSRPSTNEGADFDMDGHMDFAVGNSTGSTVGLFLGNGAGQLQVKDTLSVGMGVRGLAVIDLNGDNYPDIVTASRQQGVVSILINDGTASFHLAKTFDTLAEGETAVAAEDMNEDGIMDVVIGAYGSEEMIVYLGDGEGNLNFHDRFGAGGEVWMVVAGDVNGDGHVDVVSSNSDDSSVSVLLGDGKGGLGAPTIYPSGVFTISVDLGDLDGDGDLDIVSSNFGTGEPGTGSWVVFENDGSGHFTPRTTYHSSGAGSCVALHDRDNDGTLDITAIDELSDELVLFTNSRVGTAREEPGLPDSPFGLEVYPNPMRDDATIVYDTNTPARVLVELFDVMGRRVAVPFDGQEPARTHRIDLGPGSKSLPAGTYFVVLSAGSFKESVALGKAY